LTSVVIPTYNRADRLHRLLLALSAQRGIDDFEVIVADDGSTDDTVARARDLSARMPYRLVVVAAETNAGPAAARNRGWRAGKGSFVVFMDDDCVPEPAWLATMVAALADTDIVVGRTRPPEEQRDRIGPFSSYLDITDSDGFLTCNIGYRRAVLDTVGGFDEQAFPLQNGEDTDLGLRARKAGFGDRFVADAVVRHDVHPSDFRTHLGDVRHLEGLVALVARHPEARHAPLRAGWFLRSVDKAVLVCWAATALVVVRPRHTMSWMAAAGAAGTYGWQFGRSHYRPRSPAEWVTSVPLAFVADNWAVVVMVRASLRHRTVLL
jgi:GT2 family glycosyltransferase